MRSSNTYLTFDGACGEAMTFYKNCLGGQLTLQTIGSSPVACDVPEHMDGYILHAVLQSDGITLMGSDMVAEQGLTKGNAVSIMLNCGSEREIRTVYDMLSEGGTADHPLTPSFWGALFGDLTDKYGNHWLLNYDISKQ